MRKGHSIDTVNDIDKKIEDHLTVKEIKLEGN
jgi:hypothetical protein